MINNRVNFLLVNSVELSAQNNFHINSPFLPQLKDLLVRTIRSWVEAFEVSENNKKLPTLKMELTFDDEKMQFYPPYQDLQELITLLITQVSP